MTTIGIDARVQRFGTLAAEIHQARKQTDGLFRLVADESLYLRPVPQRHRLIFYVGHLEAFDWNLLHGNEPRFHGAFDKLFEFGIDPDASSLPSDQPADWPSVVEVRRYASEARRHVDARLDKSDPGLVATALEHRLMHAETLAYLLHNLAPELKRIRERARKPEPRPAQQEWRNISSGPATLGQATGAFGWDNEFVAHTVNVAAFRAQRYKVTNGEYLEFVDAGAPPPAFWEQRDGAWFRRGMFDSEALPLDEPVYVTQAQAQAYADWKGKRLLTEPEFHRAADGAKPAAADFDYWDPIPVTSTPESASVHGLEQLIGNGWEWTSTPFGPFPGFQPRPYYLGYSRDFFDGEHFVMKGGSTRTARRLLRPSFRNWFRRDYPHAYSGFRLAEDA